MAVHALLLERQALPHAEAVLLVDDGQAEPGEFDAFLDQGVRTDHQCRLASADFCERRRLVLFLLAARQPGDFQPERRQPLAQLAVMLLGEDLGRRHQRGLMAGLDRLQHRQRRHHRLAAADIALQQALHRMRLGQVVRHLLPDALLRRRELEGQAARAVAASALPSPASTRRTACAARGIGLAQGNLLREQFVEGDALPGRTLGSGKLVRREAGQRGMQRAHACGEIIQLQPLHQRFGQGFAEIDLVQRTLDQPPQCALPQSGRRRVNRRQGRRQRLIVVDHMKARMHQFGTPETAAHLAEDAQARTRLRAPSAGSGRSSGSAAAASRIHPRHGKPVAGAVGRRFRRKPPSPQTAPPCPESHRQSG